MTLHGHFALLLNKNSHKKTISIYFLYLSATIYIIYVTFMLLLKIG